MLKSSMDVFEYVTKITQKYNDEAKKIDDLLLAPEITADVNQVKLLSQRKSMLEEIVFLRDKILENDRLSKEYIKEFNENDPALKEMLNDLKKENDLYFLKMISLLEDKKDEKVYLKTEPLNQDILSAYRNLSDKLGLLCTPLKTGLLIEGKGADIFKTCNVYHKIKAQKNSIVKVLVFTYKEAKPVVINDKDVRTDVFLSHGKGGQNINKVETAIRLVYLPLNLIITCQDERSQLENKKKARKALEEKLKAISFEDAEKANSESQKIAERSLEPKIFRELNYFDQTLTDTRVNTIVPLKDFFNGDITSLTAAIKIGYIK